MLNAGEQIGRYRIRFSLGAGGMGEVFLADDTRLDRKVALKILPSEVAADPDRMRRFVQEAKATSALNHPNIITIHEIGDSDDIHFIVTEYIEGETLREHLKRGFFSLNDCLEVSVQIASALQAAHSVKIVHRDIKPENIMIRPDGLVKILDFGIAKLTEKTIESIDAEAATAIKAETDAGMIIGTAAYMSPEQAQGKPIDARSDIFSFGVVLYEMLSGKQPFEGESAMDVIGRILHKEPIPLNQLLPEIPAELEQIIDKALCKNCRERYQTAKDLLNDLKEFKQELDFQSKLERISSAPNKETEGQTQIFKSATDENTRTTYEMAYANSIAVMPFSNMSADAENEYFCDGLAEELLNALAKIDELKVAARTSAFSFKNKNVEVNQIGKTLNVRTVLEGSVRKSGNRLRITVQLINASDGFHLWSERYDREMKDIFEVQDEITLAVVDALKVKLFGDEKVALLKRYTDNTEAYDLYLRGLYHHNKHTAEGWLKALEYFEKAVEIEPNYAPAYAGIGISCVTLHIFGVLVPDEIIPKWKEATDRALAIDERLSEGHLSLATFYFYHEWNWAEAEREFKRSIELNANSALTHFFYGLFLSTRERSEEGIEEGRRARELDPLSFQGNVICGWIYMFADRQAEVLTVVRKLKELEANFYGAYWLEGSVHLANGEFNAAVKLLQKAVDLGSDQIVLSTLGCAYGLAGKQEEALDVLHRLLEIREQQYATAFNIARVYAGLGDNEKAFEWLEKSVEECNGEFVYLDRMTVIGNGMYLGGKIGTDLRYQDLVLRSGLKTKESALNQPTNETSKAQTAMLSSKDLGNEMLDFGLDAEPTTNPKSEIQNLKSRWWLFGLLGVVLLLSGFFAYRYFTPNNKQIESIAVLPFENGSGNTDLDYLSDGVSESVIDRLSQLSQLKVIARSSSFRYRGQNLNLQEIANALGVDAIVTGRVVSRGDSYQIRVDVTDVRENKQLWGENFTRKASDVQILQTDISREIAENLRLRLSGAQTEQIARQGTTNPQAYELLLKGRFYYNKGGRENFHRAIEYYEQAIAADPNYALTYAELAEAYNIIGGGKELDRKSGKSKYETAMQKALELDPNLAEAHFAMAQFKRDNWDWAEAESEYKRAIELNPNLAAIYSGYAGYLSQVRRLDEAVAAIRRSLELDPLSVIANGNAIRIYYLAQRYDEAIAAARKTFEIEPNNAVSHRRLGDVYAAKGMYREAIAENQTAIKLWGGDVSNMEALLGAFYAKAGMRDKAEEILQKLKARENDAPQKELAVLYDALSMRDEAFAQLEKVYAANGDLSGIALDPNYDNLRSDPRFQDLLRRMNLLE